MMTHPSVRTPPPGAAERCQECGGRLIACYPGQQLHPLCDPHPETLLDNLALACTHCNTRKGDNLLDEMPADWWIRQAVTV